VNDSPSKSRNSPFDGAASKALHGHHRRRQTHLPPPINREALKNGLEGKVAIITGSGGKGTGRAVARRFAQKGWPWWTDDTNHNSERTGVD